MKKAAQWRLVKCPGWRRVIFSIWYVLTVLIPFLAPILFMRLEFPAFALVSALSGSAAHGVGSFMARISAANSQGGTSSGWLLTAAFAQRLL